MDLVAQYKILPHLKRIFESLLVGINLIHGFIQKSITENLYGIKTVSKISIVLVFPELWGMQSEYIELKGRIITAVMNEVRLQVDLGRLFGEGAI